MSFILDALRKSEGERQREALPNLATVPLAVPSQGLPRWAVAVMTALSICVLALAGFGWKNFAIDGGANGPQPVVATLPADEIPAQPRDTGPRASTLSANSSRPLAGSTATPRAAPNTGAVSATEAAETLAPTVETVSRPALQEHLPSPAELRAQGVNLPSLKLELHSYSETAARRFVFINGRQYREAATLSEGPRLLAIVEKGAVLSFSGRQFLLTPD